MSDAKKQRVEKFRFAEDKKRTVAGEMLIRKAVAEWCDIAPESITLSLSEHSKPYTENLPVEFNISHSGNMVVCAVSDTPVGIDIEKKRDIDIKIARRVFNEEEQNFLFSAPDENQQDIFFSLWTQNEAILKCLGTGFSEKTKFKKSDFILEQFEIQDYVVSIAKKR